MTSFRPNPGFKSEAKRAPEYEKGMALGAVKTAAAIKAAALPSKHTGYYIRHVKADGTVVRIGDYFWHLIEFGSQNNEPYAPIRKGTRALGLRMDFNRR